MIALLLRGAGFAAIYLLVLTSLDPGDVAIAAVLGVGTAVAVRPRFEAGRAPASFAGPGAFAAVIGATLVEVVRGTWRTVRFCLGGKASPAFIEIPREDRTRGDVALWGVLTGEAPDEIPVDILDDGETLLVHVLDGADPDAVRARHRRVLARWRGEGRTGDA
jgi:multisubunit Na+/H+ antiporter MnhE subunit